MTRKRGRGRRKSQARKPTREATSSLGTYKFVFSIGVVDRVRGDSDTHRMYAGDRRRCVWAVWPRVEQLEVELLVLH